MQENYKILVVDDDMRLRALLERYLTEQGFQVRSVANAEQMDRLLTRESFHLMVLDLMLPGEDGLSICRRLRSQSNPMPIIMVTAKGEEIDQLFAYDLGADEYITKPFSPKILVAKIKALYKKRRDLMCESMKKYFPEGITFTYPEGGLFTWVTLPEGMDAKELMPKVLAKNVAYVPGGPFYPHGGNANHFRLNYSNMPEDRIVEGIKRLADVLKEELAK